jgi:hypothetical protein
MDKDLAVMTKLRMWHISGFNYNQKLSLQMGPEGLLTTTQYALKRGVNMLRNNTLCIGHRFLYTN